ncbi:MAG: hypothetical protein V1903_11355 [Bacteroidota bacterium]
MKRLILATLLLSILCFKSYGQWYEKKYNVTDINLLSREQLNESLKDSKTELLYSGIVSAAGAGIFVAGRFLPYEINDESSFLEQLIGERGMEKIMMATGVGIAAGGLVAGIVYLGRIGKIKSVLNEYYASGARLIVSPAVLLNEQSLVAGFSVTFSF